MDKYIVITEPMVKELGLKGNDLLVYAIIYGFSQDRESEFTGSLQYLANWTNSTKRNIMNNLNNLIEKDLITKKEYKRNGVPFCTYAINFTTMEKISIPMEKISTNNINNNLEIKKENNIITKENISETSSIISTSDNVSIDNVNITDSPKPAERFKKPTVEEVEAYCLERNNGINAQYWFDYYESKGWMVGKTKMKDWKAAVRTWEQNNKTKKNNTVQITFDDVKEIKKINESFE